MFVISCSKDVPLQDGTVQPEAILVDYSFSGEFNNITYEFNSSDPNYTGGTFVTQVTNAPPDSSYAFYQSSLVKNAILRPALLVNKGRLIFLGALPDSVLFHSFFPAGNVPYSIGAVNGIEVNLVDVTGNLWSTSEGSGFQGSHTFTITSSTLIRENGVNGVRVTADFTCILYRPFGTSDTLRNGHFTGIFKSQ